MAFIIGTAGHIDHGKTSLVRSLTGIDLDSTPEEKERGITIALGFTSMEIENVEYSFIDVPGHERLIRTMIAGATGLDAVMLCVSAVDSVMPQTIEHLNILNLLDIEAGLITITMCDLADEEDIELITEEIEELVAGTFLEGAPIIHTSAQGTGFGQDAIRSHLQHLYTSKENTSDPRPFRLPVDRVFTQKGFGTVVTGTSHGSNVQNGQTVHVVPGNIEAKVRSIQQHGTVVEESSEGRLALNLSGISVEDLSRGAVVVLPNTLPTSQIIDIEYKHLEGATALDTGNRIRLLFGSSEGLGKVYRVDGDHSTFEETDQGFLQIRLDSPHVLCKGDRCIVRRESPLETLGGGTVLDPYAPKIRQRNRAAQETWLSKVIEGDKIALLARMMRQGRTSEEYSLLDCAGGIRLGSTWYSTEIVGEFKQILIEQIETWQTAHPLKVGASRMEVAPHFPFLDKEGLQTLCKQCIDERLLSSTNGRMHTPGFKVELSPTEQTDLNNRLQRLKATGLEGIAMKEFKDMSKPLLQYALETAHILRVSNQLVHPSFINHLLIQLRRYFEHHTTLSTAEFKEMTQLSRKFSIPLLEWLDENHKTRRSGDLRVSGGMLSEDV